jgi:hypothetical protein
MTNVRISAKTLGAFNMPNFCPRCFWLEQVLWKRQAPFRFNPPRLMNRLDDFQKRAIMEHVQKNGNHPPKWMNLFGPFQKITADPRLQLQVTSPEILFTGRPDLLLEGRRGFAIVDQKTAFYKGVGDVLEPIYRVQVNGYAYLLRKDGMHVHDAGFLYFEADTKQNGATAHESITEKGQSVEFVVTAVRTDLDPDKIVVPLLKRAHKLLNQKTLPQSTTGCKNCDMLAAFESLSVSKDQKLTDSIATQIATSDRNELPTTLELLFAFEEEEDFTSGRSAA